MSVVAVVGFAGVAIVVVGWLAVSFSPEGPRRAIVEWIAACGLYLALLSLFIRLAMRAHEAGSTAALVAFAFLVGLFGLGLIVCLAHAFRAVRRPTREEASATN